MINLGKLSDNKQIAFYLGLSERVLNKCIHKNSNIVKVTLNDTISID